MSISDLFNKPGRKVQRLANASFSTFISGSEIESEKQVRAFAEDRDIVRPPIDYYNPAEFARFGSARKYYNDSFTYISENYPYDGSSFEKYSWHVTASNLDNWVFENIYPRTTGYGIFSPQSIAVSEASSDGYGNPATKEYILFYGGPNKDPDNTDINKIFPSEDGKANVYNVIQNRTSNLKFDLTGSGVTIELWMKKPFVSGSDKEVIFDLWNQATSSVAGIPRADYGRLRIEVTGAASSPNPFLVTALSGTTGFQRAPIGSTLTTEAIADDTWRHYAFTFKNNGSSVDVELYQNGKLLQTLTTGSALSEVTGTMKAHVGALVTEVSGTHSVSGTPDFTGWGKLSGSVDEFRFWKVKRNPKEVGLNWYTHIDGGTNTDTSNTNLGVYYKFNEGITGTGSIDRTVLDYSGRITNGAWTGYSSDSRNVGSAIDTAGFREFKDPIIYATNPAVDAARVSYMNSGSIHDANNTSRITSMIPSWIIEDEENNGGTLLTDLTQIIGAYFDELSTYAGHLPKIKDFAYNSGSNKPLPFTGRLLRNYGFKYDEIFTAATIIEEVSKKNEDISFSKTVSDIKNLLYNNIYVNLSQIYKTKGTSTSFRNLLHCLGIDEDVIKINAYADNITYEIRDNVSNVSQYSRFADFNKVDRHSATIYQMTASNEADSVSFISGSGTSVLEASGLSWTFESEILFPNKPELGQRNFDQFDFPHLSSSLFGMHTAKMQDPADTTWAGSDYANFQVFAVRDDYYSKDVTFVLTGTSGGPIPLLTSSLFRDVYDNSKWNFAVRVRPSKYPLAKQVEGTSGSVSTFVDDNPYNVEFYGVNYIAGQKNYEFLVSSSVSEGGITNFLSAPKRAYVGAHRTNFTSSLLQPTDVRVKSFKTWTDYISNAEIDAHARDTENFGRTNPYRNTALFNASLQGLSYPETSTLALHWRFDNVTGSDASGKFEVTDFASGSTTLQTRYDWAGNVSQAKHTGIGYDFPVSDNDVIDVDWIQRQKQLPFENINSDSDVKILTDIDDKVFTPDSRPIDYYYTLEKSMYQAISEEMLTFFATVKDFNNLIGEPVNRYRQEYKSLGKLRELFYERVENIPDVEKFVNYYKWFDDAVGTMLSNFVPASARFNTDVNTVIESHVLERNKYWNKFPTIETKAPTPEASIKGVEELNYNWKFGHAPLDSGSQDKNCHWWHDRAERDGATLTSGDANVDSDKNSILTVATTEITGSTYVQRALSRPYRLVADRLNSYKKEVKKYENKKKHFHKPLTAYGVSGTLAITPSDIRAAKDCKDDITPAALKKEKLDYKIVSTIDGTPIESGYLSAKGDLLAPFTMFSASTTGYTALLDVTQKDIEINNLHQDTYENKPAPLQGPFTEKYVGGAQHRHIALNFWDGTHKTGSSNLHNLDGFLTRPEGFFILPGRFLLDVRGNETVDSYGHQRPRANFFREEFAKRPLNIKNIKMSQSSPTVIGNYTQDYQYFQTSGRNLNNLWFRSGSTGLGGVDQPTADSNAISGTTDFTLPNRSRLEDGSKNQTVFVEKFSAPGGPEVMSRGFLDTVSETFSVYNALPFRNSTVRDNLDTFSVHHSIFGGYDGVFGEPTASFHKTYRNTRYRIEQSGGVNITASAYDNAFVQHPIPQSDANYSWISASLAGVGKGGTGLFGYLPYNSSFTSSITLPTLTASEVGSNTVSGRTGLFPIDGQIGTSLGANFVFTDYAGINSNIYEPLSASTNTLGFPLGFEVFSYLNISSASNDRIANENVNQGAGGFLVRWRGAGPGMLAAVYPGTVGTYLNGLISHRQGPYGWPSWKQIRGYQHPITRWQRNNNIISQISYTSQDGTNENSTQKRLLNHFTESAVTINKPTTHTLFVKDKIAGGSKKAVFKSAYSNLQESFINTSLNNLLGISQNPDKDTIYDNFLNFYKNPESLGIDPESNPVSTFASFQYGEIVYPRKKNLYLSFVRNRNNFAVEYWKNARSERNENNVLNSQGQLVMSQSIWPLDGRTDFTNAIAYTEPAAGTSEPTGSTGELQNQYSLFHLGNPTKLSASALFCNPTFGEVIATGDAGEGVYGVAGDARWSAPDFAGGTVPGPFYESYDEYAKELRSMGKGYSLVPEFRMSDHMEFYVNEKYGDFLADNRDFLSLTGSVLSSSNDAGFFKVYSTSDFLKHFQVIKDDHDGFARPSSLKLKCNAFMKFLPYNGFYPAQRTLQLASLFSQSYGRSMQFEGTQQNLRTLLEPVVAPGILFNSIKSCMAVDYPIYTASYSKDDDLTTSAFASNKENYHFRAPFETLVDPEFYLGNKKLVDINPHPSASIDCTGSFPASGEATYKLAMHNFLAEVPNFFLSGKKLTTFASNDDRTPFNVADVKYKNKSYTPEYRMRVVVSHAKERTRLGVRKLLPFPSVGTPTTYTSASYALNPPTIRIHQRFPSDPFQRIETGPGYGAAIPGQNMRYGSEFGPPTSVDNSAGANGSFAIYSRDSTAASTTPFEYSPHTPPYYDGYAEVEFTFKPPTADSYAIDEILSQIDIQYRRFTTCARLYDGVDLLPGVTDFAYNNAMQLSSSLNFLQKVEVKNVKFDARGNPLEIDETTQPVTKWVIQPKWESPVLDFSNAAGPPLPAQGTGSVPLGLWHQLGEIPTKSTSRLIDEFGNVTYVAGSEKGLFISLQDTQDDEKGVSTLTGSLADLVGFSKSERRLGTISEVNTVSEAVVAVPFIRKSDGTMKFYHFPRQQLKLALGQNSDFPIKPGASIVNMANTMQKYVIPPQLDFITNSSVQPFVMYLFEFKHNFNQEDLANIWQNLPPESLMKVKEPKESTVTVEHELLINELFGVSANGKTGKILPKTQWMIFKVKQKAEKNYFAMTANSQDDERFKFKFNVGDKGSESTSIPDYSYNWPYDFFSMVELAQMEADVTWTPGTDFEPDTDIIEAAGINPAAGVQPGPTDSAAQVAPPSPPSPSANLISNPVQTPPGTDPTPGQGGIS